MDTEQIKIELDINSPNCNIEALWYSLLGFHKYCQKWSQERNLPMVLDGITEGVMLIWIARNLYPNFDSGIWTIPVSLREHKNYIGYTERDQMVITTSSHSIGSIDKCSYISDMQVMISGLFVKLGYLTSKDIENDCFYFKEQQ